MHPFLFWAALFAEAGLAVRQPLLYTTVVSGARVSGDVDLSQYSKLVSIDVPVVNSGDLYLQGAFDTTSANFKRLQDNVGQIANIINAGSTHILWPLGYTPPSYARVELLSAQTDTRTFTLLAVGRY